MSCSLKKGKRRAIKKRNEGKKERRKKQKEKGKGRRENGKGGYQNKVTQIKGCNETLHGGGIALHGLQGDTVLGGMENWPGWRMPSFDTIL